MDSNEQSEGKQENDSNSYAISPALDLEKLKQELGRIVFQSKEIMVVAVTGAWGEGKTYFWKKSIALTYASERPGYVSVFGAESIQDIRERVVFEALKKPQWHKTPALAKVLSISCYYTQRLGKIGKGIEWCGNKISKMFVRWPEFIKVLFAPNRLAIQLVEDNVLKPGWTLCLDDIERLAGSVGMDVLMGYISELRDERQVKVVLIYNRNEMAGHEIAFKILQEKVIDRELPFIPKVRDSLELVFSNTQSVVTNNVLVEELERRCGVLSLKNIRLLTRMRHYYEEVHSVLPEDADKEFLKSVLFSLLLFTWVRFSQAKDSVYYFNFLSNFNSLSYFMGSRDADPDSEQEKASKLLNEYGYGYTDELDQILIEFVKSDVLNSDLLLSEYRQYKTNTKIEQKRAYLTSVWKQYYHGTLRNNESEFCSNLIAATEDCIDSIEVHNFDAVLCILSRLDRDDVSQKLLAEFMSRRSDVLENADKHSLFESIKYPDFALEWDQAVERAQIDARSIDELITELVVNDYISMKGLTRLSEFSTDELISYFTSTDRDNLTSILRRLNEVVGHSNDGEELQNRLREVITALAGQHRLNKLRMQSMKLIDSDE